MTDYSRSGHGPGDGANRDQPSRHEKLQNPLPKRFHLTGRGKVLAEGIEFRDGRVAYRWLSETPATVTGAEVPTGGELAAMFGIIAEYGPEDVECRRFQLDRDRDTSGMSGTGIVAEGVVFRDGAVAYRWLTNPCTSQTADRIEDVESIHGHNGSTSIRWVDE